MNCKALLIGINYVKTPSSALRGCANDVRNMEKFLHERLYFPKDKIESYVDEVESQYPKTTHLGIVHALQNLAAESWSENLDLAWFHYSGHGCSVRDYSGDEVDGKDEALVPSDYNVRGVIKDDTISKIFKNFNPKTKVVCVFDCCHSGTIADLKYHYKTVGGEPIVNNKCIPMNNNILTLSGCMDVQTSADAYNVQNAHKFTGALTSCLINVFDEQCSSDVFVLMSKVREELRRKRFQQVPQICTTYDIKLNKKLME